MASSDEGARKRPAKDTAAAAANHSEAAKANAAGTAAAAATAAGATNTAPQQLQWKRRKVDTPKRPLSAYNIFFQDERQRILEEMNVSQHSLLYGRYSPNEQQQQEPKPQFKFAELSRHIAAKWNGLGADAKGLYQALAEKEQIRYAREMIYWTAQHGRPDPTKRELDAEGLQKAASAATGERHEEQSHSLPGPWQDATMGKFTSSDVFEGVNLPNTKGEPTPSMRPTSPMRYAIDTLPLFAAALPGQNPVTDWSKVKEPKPNSLHPFSAMGAESQQALDVSGEAKYPSPPLGAQQGAFSLIPPHISPSLQQLSEDLDEDEQEFLIASLTGGLRDEYDNRKGDSWPKKTR